MGKEKTLNAKYRIEVEGIEHCAACREELWFGFKPWLKKLLAWIECQDSAFPSCRWYYSWTGNYAGFDVNFVSNRVSIWLRAG